MSERNQSIRRFTAKLAERHILFGLGRRLSVVGRWCVALVWPGTGIVALLLVMVVMAPFAFVFALASTLAGDLKQVWWAYWVIAEDRVPDGDAT